MLGLGARSAYYPVEFKPQRAHQTIRINPVSQDPWAQHRPSGSRGFGIKGSLPGTDSKRRLGRRIEELVSAIFERPGDDALRLVLADALLETGDPRGDLVAEQRRRQLKRVTTESKKERALLKAHRDEWLGPIAPAIKSESFRLGFVSSAAIKGGKHDFKKLVAAREWRTIERLVAGNHRNVGSISHDTAAAILAGPNLVSLQEVSKVFVDVVNDVADRRNKLGWRKLTQVQIVNPSEDFVTLVALGSSLPALTHLECVDDFYEFEIDAEIGSSAHREFLASPLASRLELLTLRTSPDALEQLASAAIERGIRCFDFGCKEAAGSDNRLCWDAASRTLTVTGGIEPSISGVGVVRTIVS